MIRRRKYFWLSYWTHSKRYISRENQILLKNCYDVNNMLTSASSDQIWLEDLIYALGIVSFNFGRKQEIRRSGTPSHNKKYKFWLNANKFSTFSNQFFKVSNTTRRIEVIMFILVQKETKSTVGARKYRLMKLKNCGV